MKLELTAKFELTPEQLKTVKECICTAWDAVASDMPEENNNEQAIEVALDADHMETYCRDKSKVEAARKYCGRLFDHMGYPKGLKYLSKKCVQLV